MQGESVGELIRRLRRARGWSQERLAYEVCLSAGVRTDALTRWDISRYENSRRTPRDWLPAIAGALDTPVAEFEAAIAPKAQQPVTVADFLPAGDPLAPLKTRQGNQVGMTDVTDLAGRVHGLRLADDFLSGGDLIPRALRELRSAVKLYREGSHTEAVGKALLSQIGELAQITGWIAADAGRHSEAERIYQLGMSAARQAGDATLLGNVSGSLAYLWTNNGSASKGVELARAALTDEAPPKGQSLALDRLAWAYTVAGDAQSALRTVAESKEALSQDSEGTENPQYLYWVSDDERAIMESRIYTELHRPLRAVPLLQDTLSRYDATHTRELVLYLSWLAEAYADANEPEESAATARRILTMAEDTASERAAKRVRIVLDRLREYADVPEVRELLDSVA